MHPTTRTHEIVAQHMRRVLIAEPATLLLLGVGLLILGWVTTRSRR